MLAFLGEFLQQFARELKVAKVDPTNEAWAKNKYVFDEVTKELKFLKVRFNRPDNFKRDYRYSLI